MKNKEKLIEYWAKSSKMDVEAARDLFKAKKYPHCLFFAHLSVEKHSPTTHNLLSLSKESGLELSDSIMLPGEGVCFNPFF